MQHKHNGFTLVELAIVLVVIGLILGMVFKGRDLIDGAKVKNASAGVTKIQAAINTYFERYNVLPGDGCTTFSGAAVTVCPTTNRNGILNTAQEAGSATNILVAAGMLQQADLRSPWGNGWYLRQAQVAAGNLAANTVYMMVSNSATQGRITAAPTAGNVDIRHVCAIDQAIDDGDPTTGTVRSSATAGASGATTYNATTDCYASTQTGQVTLAVRVLP